MRNLLAFVAALVLTVAGVGWYLGWFEVHSSPQRGGHQRVDIDIDTDKVEGDLKKGSQQALEKGKELLEKARKEQTDGDKKDPFSLPHFSGNQEEAETPFGPPKR